MLRPIALALGLLFIGQAPVVAAPPSASILPGKTLFHLSLPDFIKLEKSWNKTGIAKLFQDPKLKPFLDDLARESTLAKLGLDWSDLAGLTGGEMSVSLFSMAGQTAHVLTLDTTGKTMALKKAVAKAQVALEKQGYKTGSMKVAGYPVTTYHRPAQDKKDRNQTLYHLTRDDLLVGSDNEGAIAEILKRWQGNAADRLDQKKPYQEIMTRAKARGKKEGDLFWFMEPIGLMEAVRMPPASPRRGLDPVKILKSEGFTAIQGIGGFVFFNQGDVDILHHTAVYAPGPYQKSMRMVKTFPGTDFAPPDWVPGEASSFATGYVDLNNGFQNFASLFDAVLGEGDAGTFDDILKGLRDDPNGPRIDVSKEIIGRLGRRIILVAETEKPIGIHSVRSLVAVPTPDEAGLAQAIRRFMENDEDVKKHVIAPNVVIWEMITREKKKKGSKVPVARPKTPNSAVAVARGQLFLVGDVNFLKKILTSSKKGLSEQPDYQIVARAQATFGTGTDCFRLFARPDEEFQVVYEMARTNQLAKSNSLYANILDSLFGESLSQLDGSKFPDFQYFRPYLGPVGVTCVGPTDGWFLVGWAIRKMK